MQRGPLIEILRSMEGTQQELSLTVVGQDEAMEIRNVVKVDPLHSSHGVKVTTKQNFIWIDAAHVSAAWQARTDL